HRIATSIAGAEIPKDGVNVCVPKCLDDVLDKSCEWFFIQPGTGDLFKEIPQKWIRARDQFPCLLTREAAARPSSTRGEESVRQRLRKHVCEFSNCLALLFRIRICCQFGKQRAGKCRSPVLEITRCLVIRKSFNNNATY